MKWLEVHDPELNDRKSYVPSDSVEMILPSVSGHCYVTLKTRGKQWKVKMSADRLIAWFDA